MGMLSWMFQKPEATSEQPKQQEKPVQKPQSVPQAIESLMRNPPQQSQQLAGIQSGTDYNAHFQKLMKDSDQPGPDYLEFSNGLENMKAVPVPEEQKYRLTASMVTPGISADKLLGSAEHYKGVIEKEKIDFQKELDATKHTEVRERAVRIQKLSDENAEWTKKMEANAGEVQKLSIEKAQAEQQLLVEQTSFATAADNTLRTIETISNNIKQYLQDGTTTK